MAGGLEVAECEHLCILSDGKDQVGKERLVGLRDKSPAAFDGLLPRSAGATPNGVGTRTGSVVFTSPRVTSKLSLWHVDSDGTNPRQLTSGADDRSPVSTPDGRWIFYQSSADGQSLIMKIPVTGGKPEIVSDILSGAPAISPDGKLLAYIVALRDGFRLAVERLDHSMPKRLLPLPIPLVPVNEVAADRIAWDRDSKSVQYIGEVRGVSNLWSQSISGGPPKQLTHFPSGRIFAFAWSPDYKELALAKGDITRDVVTIDEQK